MPIEIDRARVQGMVDNGANLVEVLSADAYQKAHLPAAINIPLESLDSDTTASLAADWPVIVYCYDYQ